MPVSFAKLEGSFALKGQHCKLRSLPVARTLKTDLRPLGTGKRNSSRKLIVSCVYQQEGTAPTAEHSYSSLPAHGDPTRPRRRQYFIENEKNWKVLTDVWEGSRLEFAQKSALSAPHQNPPAELSHAEVYDGIEEFSLGLISLGVQKGQKVALFSENSSRWFVADQGVMKAGAVDVVRGSRASAGELLRIIELTDCSVLILENEDLLKKIRPAMDEARFDWSKIHFVVTLWPPAKQALAGGNGRVSNTAGSNGISGRSDSSRPNTNGHTTNGSTREGAAASGIVVNGVATNGTAANGTGVSGATANGRGDIGGTSNGTATHSAPWLSEQIQLPCPSYSFDEIISAGRQRISEGNVLRPPVFPEDLATIVLTSGTANNPKAVCLTHANLLHQIVSVERVLDFPQSPVQDTYLSLLPPWHMFERSAEYWVLSKGGHITYSGVKTFKEDLSVRSYSYFIAVPLVFTTLYNGIYAKLRSASKVRSTIALTLLRASLSYKEHVRVLNGLALQYSRLSLLPSQPSHQPDAGGGSAAFAQPSATAAPWLAIAWLMLRSAVASLVLAPLHALGNALVYKKIRDAIRIDRALISGGGTLPLYLNQFFEAIGYILVNGYGLTETSPVLTCNTPKCNVLGSVGQPLPQTELKVVDQETGEALPAGSKGVVMARGPQIMMGYYKDEEATRRCIDAEGWFNTGDVGWVVPPTHHLAARNCAHSLVIEGRSKDTIVLSSGENVEPTLVEETVTRHPLVHQVMLLGQDERRLGALIVPSVENLEAAVREEQERLQEAGQQKAVHDIEHSIISRALRQSMRDSREQFPLHERIARFVLVREPFSVDNGLLTATMKMKRQQIYDKYEKEIRSMFQTLEKQSP